MNQHRQTITGGLYLVIDPSMDKQILFQKLDSALTAGIDVLQIWNHWRSADRLMEKIKLVNAVCDLAHRYHVPVLINEEWELMASTGLDGVHFDEMPGSRTLEQIRKRISRPILAGRTIGNETDPIRTAEKEGFNYISFCAMFPSSSADSCEIVRPESVSRARELTPLPLFISGGLTPRNLNLLASLPFDGVAIISGIMQRDSPATAIREYRNVLKQRSYSNLRL